MWPLLLLFLFCLFPLQTVAPKVSWLGAPADPSRKRPFWGEASTIGIGAVALVGVTGAAVAGAALTGAAPSSSSNQNSS